MNFTDAQITRYAQEGEIALQREVKSIQKRVALATVVGVSEYTLPSDAIGITRITWKGFKLDPYAGSELRGSDSTPGSPTQGKPRFYVYSDLGYRVVKLYPAPNESLAIPVGDLWSDVSINSALIVQYVALPDFTTLTQRIPSLLRRQTVKDYVMFRCFMKEGKAMDIKAGEYFRRKFEFDKSIHKDSWSYLFSAVDKTLGEIHHRYNYPARPVLPWNFGEVCD